MDDTKNYFEELNSVDVGKHIEQKGKLSYLSWAWAWSELKTRHPDAYYTIYENRDGWNYFHDGQTCWVKTGVTVNGIEHIEYLPVMDYNNKSIPLGAITSTDVNKSIQRSLTKAVARHGLGLYIYAGEDLPDASEANVEPKKATPKKTAPSAPKKAPAKLEAKEPDDAAEPCQTHRDLFRTYIIEKKLTPAQITTILSEAHVVEDSPDETWFAALCIAKKRHG